MITGEYIKRKRIEAGLSQQELARRARISQAHVARIERGTVDPRLSTVNRILSVIEHPATVKTCDSVMNRKLFFITPESDVESAAKLMRKRGISQIPVLDNHKSVGSVREETIIKLMGRNLSKLKVRNVMERPFPVVDETEGVDSLPELFSTYQAVLVSSAGEIVGIITRSDLLGMK